MNIDLYSHISINIIFLLVYIKYDMGKKQKKDIQEDDEIEEPVPRKQKRPSKKQRHVEEDDDSINEDDQVEQDDDEAEEPRREKISDKHHAKLKSNILKWLDDDDKIRDLNTKVKKYKDSKKERETQIIDMINKLGMEESKIDIHGDDDQLRSRVYRHKSVTKGAIKEDIVKNALMEVIKDEKKVNQLVKKIESKRPINERYYLKRTKGNKTE